MTQDEDQTIETGARAFSPLILDILKAEREAGKRYADAFEGEAT